MNDLTTITLDIQTALDRAKVFKVSDDATRLKASESRQQVKRWGKAIDEEFDPLVKELYVPYKAKLAEKKELSDVLDQLDTIFKRAMESYDREQEAIRRAKAAEEEKARLAAMEADRKAREESAAAGLPPPPPALLPEAQPEPVEPVKSSGEYSVEVWEYIVTDFAAIPEEYKVLDEKKVGAVVRAMKGLTKIPGVQVVSRQDIRQRA